MLGIEEELFWARKVERAEFRLQLLRSKFMSMLDASAWNLEDSREPFAMPDGTETKLVIVDVRSGKDKNGYDYLQPVLEILDEPFSKDFTHFLHLPDTDRMSAKQLNRVRNSIKVFCEAFEIDTTRPFDPKDDWPGQEGWAILGVQSNEQYGDQNYVKKFITAQ